MWFSVNVILQVPHEITRSIMLIRHASDELFKCLWFLKHKKVFIDHNSQKQYMIIIILYITVCSSISSVNQVQATKTGVVEICSRKLLFTGAMTF